MKGIKFDLKEFVESKIRGFKNKDLEFQDDFETFIKKNKDEITLIDILDIPKTDGKIFEFSVGVKMNNEWKTMWFRTLKDSNKETKQHIRTVCKFNLVRYAKDLK